MTLEPCQTLAILCGGRSSRLRADKGLFRPLGDESLLLRALRLWSKEFAEVLVVVKDQEQATLYEAELRSSASPLGKVRVVADTEVSTNQGCAAMIGIITALSSATSRHVTVVPVDQIGLHGRSLNHLAASNSEGPCAFRVGDDACPFPSRWPRAWRERLQTLRDTGSLSVLTALREAEASWLDGTLFGHELRQPGNTPEEMNAYFGEPLLDSFGRRLAYLRFSLTEACNMACTYCLPEGFPEWLRHKARLGEEDIETVLSGFRRLGFRKVRFTGGEPTVHPGLGKAIATARRLGYEKIAMTTNGTLASRLDAWIEQGLDQINISLDSLRPETFRLLTKSRRHQHVMDVIDRALVAGITVKVNTVLMRSANGGEAGELMDWALARPIELRFIELMPTGLNQDFWLR